jgi:hypothetical protein
LTFLKEIVRGRVGDVADLAAVDVLDGGLAEEEEDVILVLQRTHEIRL